MIERGSCVPSSMPRRRRQRAGGDVAHDDFERDDLDFANQLLAHVEPAHEMRRHADLVEALEQIFGNAIVEDAFAFDHLVLLGVERRGVVLEMLDERARLGAFVEDLGFAFINASAAVHAMQPWLEEIHGIGLFSRLPAPARRAASRDMGIGPREPSARAFSEAGDQTPLLADPGG